MGAALAAVLACAAFAPEIAIAGPSQPQFMPLGGAAPAPLGYLEFCARERDQCGLENQVDANGREISTVDLSRQLTAQYYWAVAFGSSKPSQPASGSRQTAVASTNQGAARYDWTATFSQQSAGDQSYSPPAAGYWDRPRDDAPPAPTTDATSDQSGYVAAACYYAAHGYADAYDPKDLSGCPSVDVGDASGPRQTTDASGGLTPAEVWARPLDAQADATADAAPSDPARDDADTDAGQAEANDDGVFVYPGDPAFASGNEATALHNETVPQSPSTRSDDGSAQAAAFTPLAKTPELVRELDAVNGRINSAIRYVSDAVLFGDEDHWHLPLSDGGRPEGDCKDYVLEKRRALIADGVPAADLSIALVKTTFGESHAVLLVTTDEGELVLDSLTYAIRPWQEVRYHWIERQAPGQQLNWVSIDGLSRT
jgi:predicted transglutaminase-like cysteine proteinase